MVSLLNRVVRACEAANLSGPRIEIDTVTFRGVQVSINHVEALLSDLDCTFNELSLLGAFGKGLLACLTLNLRQSESISLLDPVVNRVDETFEGASNHQEDDGVEKKHFVPKLDAEVITLLCVVVEIESKLEAGHLCDQVERFLSCHHGG